MAEVLRFELAQDQLHPAFGALQRSLETGTRLGGYQLHQANRLWGQIGEPWRPAFIELTGTHYGAPLEPVDFFNDPEGCRLRINDWVEGRTNGRIVELLFEGSVTQQTVLVITNAVWFKGLWSSQFDPKNTAAADFRTASGTLVRPPMMSQSGRFQYARAGALQILELPYDGKDLGMVLLLPDDPAGLPALEAGLTPEGLAGGLSALREEDDIYVALPRFRVGSMYELSDVLREMGMERAFSASADFSGMTEIANNFISFVVHKGWIEVNEEGTEAAAATAIGFERTSVGASFVADHPFLFLIRDHVTGAILFLGRVTDPTS